MSILKAIQLILIAAFSMFNLFLLTDITLLLIPWDSILFNKYFDLQGIIWTLLSATIILTTLPTLIFQKNIHKIERKNQNEEIRSTKAKLKSSFRMWCNVVFGIAVMIIAGLIIKAGIKAYSPEPTVNTRNIIIGIIIAILGTSVLFETLRTKFFQQTNE